MATPTTDEAGKKATPKPKTIKRRSSQILNELAMFLAIKIDVLNGLEVEAGLPESDHVKGQLLALGEVQDRIGGAK